MNAGDRIIYTDENGVELGGVFLRHSIKPPCYRGPDIDLCRVLLEDEVEFRVVRLDSVRAS